MKLPMDEHGQRVLGLAIKGIDALIDEFLAAHKDGAGLRRLHDRGEVRWRLGYDEASGLITFGALMPTGEVVPVAAAVAKPVADLPVAMPTTLH